MRRRGLILAAAGAMMGLSVPSQAAEIVTLDFSGNICGGTGDQACLNGSVIGQGYGDRESVNVSHGVVGTPQSLSFWGSGYGVLSGVAYGAAQPAFGFFEFAPNPGFELRLLGFSMGCFGGRPDCASFDWSVTDGVTTLAGASGISTNFPAGAAINLNTAWVTSPLRLSWGSGLFNLGIDNISYQWRAVDDGSVPPAIPEPSTWILMILGFGAVGFAMRRRQGATVLGQFA